MIGRHLRLLSLISLPFFAVACGDESTGPTGTAATVGVRAYVDANGSGAFDAGDVPLSGSTVTLTPAGGGTALTATTNAEGLATFESVTIGSYLASLSGSVPAGAVLVTATSPVVVVPFQGGTIASEFRYAFNPGTIAGVLYRDNNANNVFDPGTDTPAPGISVALFSGTTAAGDTLATTTTDASGAFSFAALRPGDYTLAFDPFPTIELVGGNERQVTVPAQGTADVDVQFTGNLVVTIAEARAAASGEIVAVRGVVTWQPSYSIRDIFIQDETGGIALFQLSAGAQTVTAGDTILVVGTRGAFRGETQLSNISTLIVGGRGPVPAPRSVTADEVNAGQFQGQLVSLISGQVVDVDTLSFGNQMVLLRTATGDSVAVYADSRTGVTAGTWVLGTRYDVTGVLGTDNAVSGTTLDATYPHRIEVRSPADVAVSTAPLTIAQAKNETLGDTVTVEGIVTAAQGTFRSDNMYIQDATSGIQVFNVATDVNAALGDRVRVTGLLGVFNDEKQIVRFSTTSPPVVVKIGTATVPTPVVLNCTQLNSLADEGELATLQNVTVTSVPTTGTSYNITVTDASNVTCQVRVDGNVGQSVPRSFWEVGARYNLTGVIGQFRGTAQLKVRGTSDIAKQ